MKKELVYLGADHAGFTLKEQIKARLEKNYSVIDEGAFDLDKEDDYPDFAALVAKRVSANPKSAGILFCGSGQGMCITANKFRNIRAVAVSTEKEAVLTREHNDANILCLSSWFSKSQAEKIVNTWLKTNFSKEARHIRRLRKISKLER